VFWGQPLEGQDADSNWQSVLRTVTDPDGGSTLEYEAHLEGIEHQLETCGRVMDLNGAPLNFDTLNPLLYELKRERQATNLNGDVVYDIDIGCDKKTASSIKSVMAAYYKDRYGIQYTQEVGRGANEQFMQTHGVAVNSYDIEDEAVRINVISDPSFHDLVRAAPTAHQQASRYAMILDWSDIDWFTVKSASRESEFPPRGVDLDSTRYVIEVNHKRVRQDSITHGVAVNVPERHLLLKGFSDECPILSASACTTYEG